MDDKVWMQPPYGGEPECVPATMESLTPLMVAGWKQCEPPAAAEEESDGKHS